MAHKLFSSGDLDFTCPPKRVIDAGSNAGYATIAMNKRRIAAEIAALKPDPDKFVLTRLAAARRLGMKIRAEGEKFLHYP